MARNTRVLVIAGEDSTTREEVGLAIVRKSSLYEHGSDGKLVQVGRTEVVVDPTAEACTLSFLAPVIRGGNFVLPRKHLFPIVMLCVDSFKPDKDLVDS
jgi:hypothetical protein